MAPIQLLEWDNSGMDSGRHFKLSQMLCLPLARLVVMIQGHVVWKVHDGVVHAAGYRPVKQDCLYVSQPDSHVDR